MRRASSRISRLIAPRCSGTTTSQPPRRCRCTITVIGASSDRSPGAFCGVLHRAATSFTLKRNWVIAHHALCVIVSGRALPARRQACLISPALVAADLPRQGSDAPGPAGPDRGAANHPNCVMTPHPVGAQPWLDGADQRPEDRYPEPPMAWHRVGGCANGRRLRRLWGH